MLKPLATSSLAALALAFAVTGARADDSLTALEKQWLDAAEPVLAYADEQKLPLDIVVQPVSRKGDVPIALGYDGGRCTLVFTFRRNPDADAMLEGVAPQHVTAVIQAVVAHEIAHCWRHTHGTWRTPPARVAPEANAARREMEKTRVEEGFADLVALAWISSRIPDQYADVHAWLRQVRDQDAVPGSHHDTGAWIRLAQDRTAFDVGGTPFEQATAVWITGCDQAG